MTAGRLSKADQDLWAPFLALVWTGLSACPPARGETYSGCNASVDVTSVLAALGSGISEV